MSEEDAAEELTVQAECGTIRKLCNSVVGVYLKGSIDAK